MGFPSGLERIVRRCLRKNPNDRYNDSRDLVLDLKEEQQMLSSGTSTAVSQAAIQTPAAPRSQRWILKAGIGLCSAAIVAAGVMIIIPRNDRGPSIPPSHKQITFLGNAFYPAISQDGKFLAYIKSGINGERDKLFVHDLSGGQPLQVLERESLRWPAWSSDGSELMIGAYAKGTGTTIIVPRLGGSTRELNELHENPTHWLVCFFDGRGLVPHRRSLAV